MDKNFLHVFFANKKSPKAGAGRETMRVMISQPMNGLTREQIDKNRAAAVEALKAQGHTVVDSIVADAPPKDSNEALYYLGKSLEIMATCDAVLFIEGWENARGCRIERAACRAYGLEVMYYYDSICGFVAKDTYIDGKEKELLANELFAACIGYKYKTAKEAVPLISQKMAEKFEDMLV